MRLKYWLCVLLMAGCSRPPGQFAYVSSGDDRICAFKVTPDGSLEAASNTSISSPRAMELSSDGSSLVAVAGGDVQAFHRDLSSGNLTAWGKGVSGGGGLGSELVCSRDNFYGSFYGTGGVMSYRLDSQEGLKALSNFSGELEQAEALAVAPDGNSLVALFSRPSSTLALLKVTPRSGQMELRDNPPAGGNPHGVAVDPSGKWVLAVSSMVYQQDPKLFVFQMTGDDLAEVGNITIPSPQSVVIHPNGKWVYVGHYLPDSKGDKQEGVAQYLLDPSNGSVKLAVEGSPDGKSLKRLALDPGGQHLYAVDREGNCLLHYRLDGVTGAPQKVGEPVPVEKPFDMVITRPPGLEKK